MLLIGASIQNFSLKGSYVSQFKHTILLRPTCKEVISRGDEIDARTGHGFHLLQLGITKVDSLMWVNLLPQVLKFIRSGLFENGSTLLFPSIGFPCCRLWRKMTPRRSKLVQKWESEKLQAQTLKK